MGKEGVKFSGQDGSGSIPMTFDDIVDLPWLFYLQILEGVSDNAW